MTAPEQRAEIACPACGATRLRAVQTHAVPGVAHEFTMHACSACGVDHWRPLVHPGAEFYESEKVPIYRALHEAGDRSDPRFARFFSLFQPWGKRFLDIGCSDGAFLSLAYQRGNEVEGIDIDERALAIAQSRGIQASRRHIDEFVSSSLAEGKSFDFITVFDVIEHLTDPVAELTRLALLLSPGGRIVGTVPNKKRLLANEMSIDFPPHHFFRFDENGLRVTLQAAGLRVEHVEVFQYNYAAQTALNMLLRPLRNRRRADPTGGRSQSSGSAARPRARRLLKGLFSAGIHALSTPISYSMELPSRRGFKLLFVAAR